MRVSGGLVPTTIDRELRPAPVPALRLTAGRGNMIVDNLLFGQTEIVPGSGIVRATTGEIDEARSNRFPERTAKQQTAR